jgi:predicted lipoprotein with Yx(FWY)xxD motif
MLTVATAVVAAAAVVLVVLLARSPASNPQRTQVGLHDGRDVRVARTKIGPILVNGQGHTLYLFLKDRHGTSTCYDGCARVWPPAISSGTPRAGAGVAAAKLSTTMRADHKRQLVYNGHPLYSLTADSAPGQASGQGFQGRWFVVSPTGRAIVPPGSKPAAGY